MGRWRIEIQTGDKPMFDTKGELEKLSVQPGIYIICDKEDGIIYMGKVISLESQVRQYFQSNQNKTTKIERIVSGIARFEYIITDSELEALVLKCNLIKEHHLRYDTVLKDDRGYPYIKVTVSEDFPRVLFAGAMKKGKSECFGSYTSVGAVKDIIDLIHEPYKVRACNQDLSKDISKSYPYLSYHIKQYDAPYRGYINKEGYWKSVSQALGSLNGQYGSVLKVPGKRMQDAPDELDLEEAIEYQELLTSVRKVVQKQEITSSSTGNRGIIAMARDEPDAVVQVFSIREGKLAGQGHFHTNIATAEDKKQILISFIKQFYTRTSSMPRELWVQAELKDVEVINQWLGIRWGQKVRVVVPQEDQKERLVEPVRRDAALVLSRDKGKIKREGLRTIDTMDQIGELIGVEGIRRIKTFGVSNISSFESMDPVIIYEDGKPKWNGYRRLRVKWMKDTNDYAFMREILVRRFTHRLNKTSRLKEKGVDETCGGFTRFPGLIMMDDGRGQVNIALEVLEELKLDILVRDMVKDDNHRTRGLYYDNMEVPIDKHSEGLRSITRIQDEAHRSAIEYHRALRGKGQVKSTLSDVLDTGPTRKKVLMRQLKAAEAVRGAAVEELEDAPGMNQKVTESVCSFFH